MANYNVDAKPPNVIALVPNAFFLPARASEPLGSLAQARSAAAKAARAAAAAAGASMAAVEGNVTLYVAKRDYLRLKEMAEASDIAGKVQALGTPLSPQARQTCWIGNTKETCRHATFYD